MRRKAVVLTVGVLAAASILCGCGRRDSEQAGDGAAPPLSGGQVGVPSQPPADTETLEQMVDRWKAIAAESSAENPMLEEATELAAKIAAREPRALLSLLDVVDDDDESPFAKILATLSLQSFMGPHTAQRVIAMTEPHREPTTRACATILLHMIVTDEATETLRRLRSDEEPRVRMQAQIGLGMRDFNERGNLHDLYRDPQTPDQYRMNILEAIAQSPASVDEELIIEVIEDQTVNDDIRALAIQVLGQIGSADHIDMLSAFLDKSSEELRDAANEALDDVQRRIDGIGQITLPLQ